MKALHDRAVEKKTIATRCPSPCYMFAHTLRRRARAEDENQKAAMRYFKIWTSEPSQLRTVSTIYSNLLVFASIIFQCLALRMAARKANYVEDQLVCTEDWGSGPNVVPGAFDRPLTSTSYSRL